MVLASQPDNTVVRHYGPPKDPDNDPRRDCFDCGRSTSWFYTYWSGGKILTEYACISCALKWGKAA